MGENLRMTVLGEDKEKKRKKILKVSCVLGGADFNHAW